MKYTKLQIPNNTAFDRVSLIKFFPNSIRKFYNGIKNFYNWYYIIYNDTNYDYDSILKILEHKIFLQRNYLVNANRTTETNKINEKATLILNLIDMLRNEYHVNIDKLDEIYQPIYSTENNIFKIVPLKGTEEEYLKEFRVATQKDVNKQKQIKRLLFKVLEKNLDLFWD